MHILRSSSGDQIFARIVTATLLERWRTHLAYHACFLGRGGILGSRADAVCGGSASPWSPRKERDDVSPGPRDFDRSKGPLSCETGTDEQPRVLDPAAAEYYGWSINLTKLTVE